MVIRAEIANSVIQLFYGFPSKGLWLVYCVYNNPIIGEVEIFSIWRTT